MRAILLLALAVPGLAFGWGFDLPGTALLGAAVLAFARIRRR